MKTGLTLSSITSHAKSTGKCATDIYWFKKIAFRFMTMVDKKTSNLNLLRTVALIIMIVGAVGSLYFMFNAGRNQKSILLIVLFTGWVLSPFVGLFLATLSSRIVPARASLWLMIIVAIASLIAYSGVLIPPGTKTAFIFLVAPFTFWILILIVLVAARRRTVP